MKSLTNQEIMQGLKDPGVIAVRKLESGDLRVFAVSKHAKEKLASNLGWIHKELPNAAVVAQPHQVLVHGFRTLDFNPKDPRHLQKIQEENGRLHPTLQVPQAAWLKNLKAREGKTHSSIILNVQSQTQAKEIVQKGLVSQGTLLSTEEFDPKQRATQCLQCGHFGHVAKYCRSEQACGKCAGPHRTDSCQETTKKCSNCKGTHTSWSLSCKVKQAAIAKARSFKAQATKGWGHLTHPREMEEWTVVGSKRKATGTPSATLAQEAENQSRRPPGRPAGTNSTTLAGRTQSNKILSLFLLS